MAGNVAAGHSFKDKVGGEGAAPRSRQARVGKELAGMAVDLPLNVSSSVFLRVDETHMMLWKALITGMSSSALQWLGRMIMFMCDSCYVCALLCVILIKTVSC